MENMKLPVPTQEKVARWVTWGIIGAAGVAALNFALPHLNTLVFNAAELAKNGMYLTFMLAGLLATVYGVITFAPLFVQAVNVLSARATWALVEADPVGHLRVWLKEVRGDKEAFFGQLEAIGQAIGTVEGSRDAAQGEAEKAQNRYNAAKSQGRDDASMFSVNAGKYGDSVKRFEKMLGPLKMLEAELQKLYRVYEREEFGLATDIDIQSKEWEVAQRAGSALDSAFRFLTKKSKKQAFAEQASKVIADRYAGQFGRLRTLKNMSHDLIATFDLETGMYDERAYLNWQQATTQVIDNSSGKLEAVPVARVQAAKPLF